LVQLFLGVRATCPGEASYSIILTGGLDEKQKTRGSRGWGMDFFLVSRCEKKQKATGCYAERTRGRDSVQLEIGKTMQSTDALT